MSQTDAIDAQPKSEGWWGPVRSVLSTLLMAVGVMAVMTVVMARGPSDKPTPAVSLRGVSGEPLPPLGGKPTVLYFWATWCPACKMTSPTVSNYANRHPDVRVIGVAVDEPDAVKAYLAESPRAFTTAIDEGHAAKAFEVRAFPTTFALDASGRVTWSRQGVLMPGELDLRAGD